MPWIPIWFVFLSQASLARGSGLLTDFLLVSGWCWAPSIEVALQGQACGLEGMSFTLYLVGFVSVTVSENPSKIYCGVGAATRHDKEVLPPENTQLWVATLLSQLETSETPKNL